MPFCELSVSARPGTLPIAVVRVESSGLFDAAVATGESTMPSAEPGPEVGTALQPGPKMSEVWVTPSAAALVGAALIGALLMGALLIGALPVVVGSELPQAARARLIAAMAPTAASRWVFRTGSSWVGPVDPDLCTTFGAVPGPVRRKQSR